MSDDTFYEFKILTEKIADFKDRNNLTYQEFGDATGVNKSHIHRVINRESFPSLKFIIRLARFMRLPVFSLFLASEEMNRKEFASKVKEGLKQLEWDVDELGRRTNIPVLRLMDIFRATSSPSRREYAAIIETLNLEKNINFLEIKLNLMEDILRDLNLKDEQIENVMKYVEDNIG